MNPTLDLLRRSWREYWSVKPRLTTPYWMQWLWTLSIGVAWGLGVPAVVLFMQPGKAIGTAQLLAFVGDNLIVAITISVTIHLLIETTTRLLGARFERMSTAAAQTLVMVLLALGIALGWPLGMSLSGVDVVQATQRNPAMLRLLLLISLVSGALAYIWFRGERRRLEAEALASDARARLLQGQIEPHFLFNTLANVVSLIEADPPRARQMLETFIDYLRASLGPLRRDGHTLAQELALVEHYLALLQMRMGQRLRFRIDVPPAAMGAQMPPLVLQPLVENAVHHGLEPQLEGGEVHVRACLERGRLRLEVHDNGLGLGAPRRSSPGQGMALQNIRARLQALHGHDAWLQLQATEPGTLAVVELPYRAAPQGATSTP